MTFDSPQPLEWRLVFDAWANSFRRSPWAGCIPNHLYDEVSRAVAEGIVDRGARVLVAVTPIFERENEFPEVRRVMGYSVSEPDRKILHWLYVKDDFRGTGVGRALLKETCPEGQWSYTFRTRASERFLNKHGRRFFHDPVPARTK
jgi:GNAT superfamily N-acetyltransferase